MEHVDYPHEPGTLYDCPKCEFYCHCSFGYVCIACYSEPPDRED